MKMQSIAFLAASVLTLSVSSTGFAQGGSDAQAKSVDGSAQEPRPAEDERAAEESASQADDDSDSEQGEPRDEPSAREPGADQDEADEPKVGPGGKPLREDYPGTEESKKERMDTERIEGLAFEEGDTSDEVYNVRIRELETKVDDLKEKVFRSKSRIVLLKETVLSGNLAGSRAIVSHENALGGAYELKRAHYTLDGAQVFNEADDDGELADKDSFELFNGSITPGSHRLSILLELKGSGYGLFSYMDDYKFTIKDSCEFSAQEGSSTVVRVRLIDRGGAMSAYEDRPGIECVLDSVDLSSEELDIQRGEVGSVEEDGDDAAKSQADEPAAN